MATLCNPHSLDAAMERANRWTTAARPIIEAIFALEDIDFLFHRLPDNDRREARDILREPARELHQFLEGMRDNFLCDERKSFVTGMTEEEGDEVDEFNDELERGCVSVAAAIKAVAREM